MALPNLSLCYGMILGGMLAVLGSAHPAESSAENSVKVNDKLTKSSSLLKILYPQGFVKRLDAGFLLPMSFGPLQERGPWTKLGTKTFFDGSPARGWEFPVVTRVDADNRNTVWETPSLEITLNFYLWERMITIGTLFGFFLMTGELEMPQCDKWSVCSRIDTYSRPWVEKLCSCGNGQKCSTSLKVDDGHTVVDRTRQYKVCESVAELPTCRFFKDITWTHITGTDNTKFQQRVHCQCPQNSTTYISGHDIKMTPQGILYYYHFSCSPESGMRCRRKEPCRLFTVRKRFPVEEVTTSTLCQCPPKTTCPTHHTDPFVITDFDSNRPRDGTRTYSGFCGSYTL